MLEYPKSLEKTLNTDLGPRFSFARDTGRLTRLLDFNQQVVLRVHQQLKDGTETLTWQSLNKHHGALSHFVQEAWLELECTDHDDRLHIKRTACLLSS